MGRNTPESPGNAKKRRRTSTTAAAASLPQSSPVPDLVPPPLSCECSRRRSATNSGAANGGLGE